MTWFVNVTCVVFWLCWIGSIAGILLNKRHEKREQLRREFQEFQRTHEPLSLPRYDVTDARLKPNRPGARGRRRHPRTE